MEHRKNDAMISKIISGGQTGVDRAALDVAIKLGITHGGWCPKGRLAEDGIIQEKYKLSETSSSIYQQRTRMNIQDSDITLIVIKNIKWGSGTLFTKDMCIKMQKKFAVLDVDELTDPKPIRHWLMEQEAEILNVAGNRESTSPGIYQDAYKFFLMLFDAFEMDESYLKK
jgi:predicted Rossmann fold nucleotide-binding protein DprA/Smf involved in DNA uptake